LGDCWWTTIIIIVVVIVITVSSTAGLDEPVPQSISWDASVSEGEIL
jgi:hypothetical protein